MLSMSSKSYSKILKSSSLVGGAQIIRVLIGIIQTKCVALFLGPAGVGLIGAYQSIVQLSTQLSGLGINQSGVRDVAVAAGADDRQKLARTVLILRRICLVTGVVGAIILACLSLPICRLTFSSSEHVFEVALLAIVVFFTLVAQGQMAIIQGMRRITDLVRVQIIVSIIGVLTSIPLYIFLGQRGIVPSLLVVGFINLCVTWKFSRVVDIDSADLSWREIFSGAESLVALGVAFMLGGLVSLLTIYATRVLVIRVLGIDALGLYEAAFAISGYLLNFVLGAMGADFYPRLASVEHDHKQMTQLVNEQTEIGLLLATPALLAMLGMAPFVINILYTIDFYPASILLRWFSLGCFLQVISWPMGFVILAKGDKKWFVFSQAIFCALNLSFIFVGLQFWGLNGVAIAFCLTYFLHVIGIRLIAGHLIEFTWTVNAKKMILVQLTSAVLIFLISLHLTDVRAGALGGFAALLMSIYCLAQLADRLGDAHGLSKFLRKMGLLR